MSGQRFVTGSRDQGFLLPPDMREWLPADYLVWAVSEAVECLDLSAFEGEYREDGQGRPAYEPRLMVTLLLYAYAVGERSSRGIERRCREDVAFRVAVCGLAPDHVTIARFRRRHERALVELFTGVLRLCAVAGVLRLGTIAIDGTKVWTDANKNRLAPLSPPEAAQELLREAEERDRVEDALPRAEQAATRGLLSGELADPARRAERFAQAAQRLDEQPAEEEQPGAHERTAADAQPLPADGAAERKPRRSNKTDPESRMMLSRHGWIQGYNAQVAVDEAHLIIACDVSAKPTDYQLLQPMIALTEHALQAADGKARPGCYLADAGYWNGAVVEQLCSDGRRLLVKPNGQKRRPGSRSRRRPVVAMERRLAHPANRRRYQRRQALAEPVIAQLKLGQRLDRFRLRGQAGARLEWTLACTAHNLRRLHRIQSANA